MNEGEEDLGLTLKIWIRRDELAEVCLDGEVLQTCPPDFAEWLPLKLWFLDAKIILEFLI
jgi:hypothetical protein